MPPLNYQKMITEVEAALPCARKALDDAIKAQAFFDYEGDRYGYLMAREAESPQDQQIRPYRPSGFTRECCEVLTEHLYSPGPSRTWSDASGDELLQRVYTDNDLPGMMADADELSTLNDACAIQIDAKEGKFAEKPITLRLWGRDQLHVFTDPNDALEPSAVVTIDQYDETTRYRLWTDEEVRTFETRKGSATAAHQVAVDPNTYGVIPFTFIHYKRPVRRFFEPGISDLVVSAEIRINDRLSRLDESIHKHLNPIPTATGVPADWQPIIEPMRFIRLRSSGSIGASGGYEKGAVPQLAFLQAQIDIAGAWSDLRDYILLVLEAARIPQSAVRMEQTDVASGISLIVEQAALLTRARRRRGPFSRYELDLARRVLTCAGNHYGRQQYVTSARAGTIQLAWPQPSIPIPTMDRLDLLKGEVAAGYKSHLMAVEEWYGVDRMQAESIVRQIEADGQQLATLAPSMVPPAPADESADTENDPTAGGDGGPPTDPIEDD